MSLRLFRHARSLRWTVTAVLPAAAISLLAFQPAFPCGPFFPPQILTPDAKTVAHAPVGDLRHELDRVVAGVSQPLRAVPAGDDPAGATYDADVAELKRALPASGLPPAAQAEIAKGYEAARQAFRRYAGPSEEWAREQAQKGKADALPEWAKQLQPPAGTPIEFAEYLRGAVLFRFLRHAEARVAFEKVLALPAAQRRHRSTWAAYMLGRSLSAEDGPRAAAYFAQVRELVKAGFHDSLGLGAASVGEEARIRLARGEWVAAIRGYALQHKTGDTGAAASVRLAIRRAFNAGAPDVLTQLAREPLARHAVTAFIVANGGPAQASGLPPKARLRAWLDAVEAVAAEDVEGADRLAWAAYQQGEFAIARRWVERAPKDAVMAKWVLAKLYLRDGKLADAAPLLAEVAQGFPENERWNDISDYRMGFDSFSPRQRAQAELGGVRLARREYEGALDALLRSGYWVDAAYVAERVLTLEELQSYVDRTWPAPPPVSPPPRAVGPSPTAKPTVDDDEAYGRGWGRMALRSVASNLRMLLARRLVRAGRVADARPYTTPKYLADLEALRRHLAESEDAQRPPQDRARSLFEAGRITRRTGLELRGTEIEPDHGMYGANYDVDGPSKYRAQPVAGSLLPSSDDERARLRKHAPAVDKRFHYRYVAADMALRAAMAFPKNHPEAARMLCIGGSWLKRKDPQAADPLYKALVRRNPNLPLGKRADALRWFPSCEK